ncbi:T9SS type A sorting domain-containing protein [Brumimicrobium aurantiacum]|nr:T9SS type A sorting domain-containing protein [Brumimicrobium aurantiacum]
MKTLLATLFIFNFSILLFAQSWADQGANWKYNYSNGFGLEGYTQIKYVGDTVIGGQNAQILDKHLYGYDQVSSEDVEYDLGSEYTYENNGVVYLRHNNSWDTLYHFNAGVGDSWRAAKQPQTSVCDSNSRLLVIATGTKTVNAISLNYVVVELENYNGVADTILEKVGFINSYMFPYDDCDGALDVNEGGAFRCYSDQNFPTYKPRYGEECDYILNVNDESIIKLSLVPNPASSQLEIQGVNRIDEVRVGDLQGKNCAFNRQGNTLLIEQLPKGVYVISIRSQGKLFRQKFIKE